MARLRQPPNLPIGKERGLRESGQGIRSADTRMREGGFITGRGDTGASLGRNDSQRKEKKKSEEGFQIFHDADAFLADEAEETDNDGEEEEAGIEEGDSTASPSAESSLFSSSRSSQSSIRSVHSHESTRTTNNNKDPLRLARVNSLLLPSSQQARHDRERQRMQRQQQRGQQRERPRKSDIYNWDKENDPVEEPYGEEEEEEAYGVGENAPSLTRSSSDASSQRGPARSNGLFSTYRRRESVEEEDEEQPEEDDGFDSMDDFIVSDNEDVSFHGTVSGGETEDEEEVKIPSPPPKPRRRLIRGRRPAPKVESDSEGVAPPKKEQSPIVDTIPSLKPESARAGRSQKGFNIAEGLDTLNLNDDDASCHFVRDLNDSGREVDFSIKKPAPTELPLSKQQTPPSSPTKNKRLNSPTKSKVRIPPTPYRENTDAFWSQETTNNWVDRHSPSKVEQLLREFEDSDDEDRRDRSSFDIMSRRSPVEKKKRSPTTNKSPSKTALKRAETELKRAALARKKSFDDKKNDIAYDFLRTLDDAVTGGQVQELAEPTGGVHIVWSKTLQTTAGRARFSRIQVTNDGGQKPTEKKLATIELAARVIDSEDRLISTLAHEYCHLTNFMITREFKNPHGANFKQWGAKCKAALANHPRYGGRVEVTTKHSYKIDYKYVWACVDCACDYGRHSKSIDTNTQRCGKCRGVLQQIKPKPRNVTKKSAPTGAGAADGGVSPVEKKVVDDVVQVLGAVNLG